MKLIKAVAVALSVAVLTGIYTGCNKNKYSEDSDQTLRIFTTNAGYGTKWLTDSIEAFKQESWVKEKYPNLNIPAPDMDAITKIAESVTAGPAVNPYSLLFSCQPVSASYESFDENGNCNFEDISDVYFGAIPGESAYDGSSGKQLKDKFKDSTFENEKYVNLKQETHYYSFPWVRGMSCIWYNKTKLNSILTDGYELPLTTDQLIDFTAEIKANIEGLDAPWAFVSGAQYCVGPSLMWWAQYVGVDGYERYWSLQNEDGEYSSESFKNKGRQYYLEILESLIGRNTGYTHSASMTNSFMQLQTKFYKGTVGVLMFTGDWLENEMGGIKTNQDIDMLRIPVISNIVELCSSVKTDEALAYVVKCVDENKDYETTKAGYTFGNLTEKDYNRIYEARRMVDRVSGHQAFIPSYAKAKGVAKDFLRFMASDKGIYCTMSNGKGIQTVFEYEADEALYNTFSTSKKTMYNIYKNECFELVPFTSKHSYIFGGLREARNLKPEVSLAAQNAKDYKSAKAIYDEEVDFWTKNEESNFVDLLTKCGWR